LLDWEKKGIISFDPKLKFVDEYKVEEVIRLIKGW
jgi:hypothetical protein